MFKFSITTNCYINHTRAIRVDSRVEYNTYSVLYLRVLSREIYFFEAGSVHCNYLTSLLFRQVAFRRNTITTINVCTIKTLLYNFENYIFFLTSPPPQQLSERTTFQTFLFLSNVSTDWPATIYIYCVHVFRSIHTRISYYNTR